MNEIPKQDLWPLFLYEAVLSLYQVGPDGSAAGSPVWWDAVANGLRVGLEYEETLMMSSGGAYQRAHHLDEHHTIEIERTWLLPKIFSDGQAGGDFRPGRNQGYVLEIVWNADGQWYRRTYFGVTGRTVGWDSQRALQFGNRQAYRAERYDEDGGGQSAVFTPLASALDEQCIGFFRENPMAVGEYMLGHYRWPVAVNLLSARVVGFAPQNVPQVLTLEVGGVLTDQTITIPVGLANTEVSATVALNFTVQAGQSVRWKIAAGPAPEDAAYVCAVGMQVQAR